MRNVFDEKMYAEYAEYMLVYSEKYGGNLDTKGCWQLIADELGGINPVTYSMVERALDEYTSEELAEWRNILIKERYNVW